MNDGFLALVEDSGLDPVRYQYFHQLNDNRTIVFNTSVDESIVENVILPLKDFEKDDSDEPVTLILSTLGGSVADGLVLCNIIDGYQKKLEIYMMGHSYSMGTLFLCAGNKNPNVKKFCYPFSFALFHSGYTVLEGESLSVKDTMSQNQKVDNMIKDYVVANTNITEEEYTANERRQWYLNAQEMKAKGLIDVIIGEDDDN